MLKLFFSSTSGQLHQFLIVRKSYTVEFKYINLAKIFLFLIDYATLLSCVIQSCMTEINFVYENISLPAKEVLFTAANIVGTQSCRCIKSLLIFEAGKFRLHMQAAPRTPPSHRVFFTYDKHEYSALNNERIWLRISLMTLKPESHQIVSSHHKNFILKAYSQMIVTITQLFGTLIACREFID